MAAGALRDCSGERATDMAPFAGHADMRAIQNEACAEVIKGRLCLDVAGRKQANDG